MQHINPESRWYWLVRLVHLADLHLGWRPRFAPDDVAARLTAERITVLSSAIDYALAPQNRVHGLLLAGDIFDDHRPSTELVEQVLGLLGRASAAGLILATVPGNHDELTYADSVFRHYASRWPGLLVTAPRPALIGTVDAAGTTVTVYGVAYVGGISEASAPLKGWPRPDGPGLHIALAHGTVVGAGGLPEAWAADERSLPLDADDLGRAGYDYIALGHIHRSGAPAGWPGDWSTCRYGGLVAGRGFDDPGSGRFVVAEIAGRPQDGVRLVEHQVAVTGYHEMSLDAAGCADQAALLAAAGKEVAQLGRGELVRMVVKGVASFALDAPALAAALAARGQLGHVEVVDDTIMVDADRLEALAAERTVRGFFVRRLADKMDAARREGDLAAEALAHRALRYGIEALIRERRA